MSDTKKKKVKKEKQSSGISINVISFFSFLMFAIVLLGTLYFSQQDSLRVLAKQYQAVADNEIKNTALKFTLEANKYSLLLQSLAKDPALIELFRTKNLQALEQRADELRMIFPSTLRVRLLLGTTHQPNDLLEPRFTYACLDLLKQSREQSSNVKLEMHELKGNQQHIDIMQAVSLRGKVVGFIQFAMEPSLLDSWLKKIAGSTYIEVHQEIDDQSYLIAKTTSGSKQGTHSVFNIPDTHWQIETWKTYHANESVFSLNILLIFTVAILFTSIMVFVFRSLLHKKLVDDLEKYMTLVAETVKGIKNHKYDFSLTEFKLAATQVENISVNQTNFDREHDADTGKNAKAEKDTMPDIDPMFMAKDSIQIEELDDTSTVEEPEHDINKIEELDDISVIDNPVHDTDKFEALDDTSIVESRDHNIDKIEELDEAPILKNLDHDVDKIEKTDEPRVLEELEFEVVTKDEKDNK